LLWRPALFQNRKKPITTSMAKVTSLAEPAEPANNTQERDQDHDARFFNKDDPIIPAKMAELLEQYSGLPAGDAQVEHVHRLRDRAYQEYQYPCLGLYRFLGLALSNHPLYEGHVVPLLRGEKKARTEDATRVGGTSRTFLDLGTCLGQDIRKLIFDGVPMESVYGADILTEFVDLGYDLFGDEDRLPRSHFVAPADIFDDSSPLKVWDGKVDIVHANSVFHLFSWDDQVKAAKRVTKLLRPEKGSLILGSQIAHAEPGEVSSRPGRRTGTMYIHDEKSWETLWTSVGQEVGLTFTVRSSISAYSEMKGTRDFLDGISRMTFEIWRD
jgi:SAM-dependent methyltransferase